jgi:diaminopimelate decarboxylase
MCLTDDVRAVLTRTAEAWGTPCYAYDLRGIEGVIADLTRAFEGRFQVSYAVKSNPNRELLRRLLPLVETLDVSSIGELERALEIGCDPALLSFSGPAKRLQELERAVDVGCGEIVCESEWELRQLQRLSSERGRRTSVLIRINPASTPKKFGVRMSGRPSQFGIDEEDLAPVLDALSDKTHLEFLGFHVYSATNSLSEEGIAANFAIMIELFERFSEAHDLQPTKLIFGSGFGIPYHDGDEALDLDDLSKRINGHIDTMRQNPRLSGARLFLEMGRYIVGPHGYFLTSVVNEKRSRGTEIRLCDGGMNNHLAACGHMGMVIRRNYPMWNISAKDDSDLEEYMLVGPLCTTIDTLATKIELARLSRGDVIAIGASGAYGASASPTEFISHPKPKELLIVGAGDSAEILDITQA